MGPDQNKDCRFWSQQEKIERGCGSSCGCPAMTQGLDTYHKYKDLYTLYQADKKGLDDIWDEDWLVVQQLMIQEDIYKKEKNAEAERIASLMGKSQGSRLPKLK